VFHNPWLILRPFVREGMTVLDFGCGPGFFTMKAAEMVGQGGRVIASDLQQGMLDIVAAKAAASPAGGRVELSKCGADRVGVEGPLDFVLAIFVVHEVPDKTAFFDEMRRVMRPGARMLVAEPRHHVDAAEFEDMKTVAARAGFKAAPGPFIAGGRSVVLIAA
jgi:ubiquinone/menaquinone biosynthesis C-methylase UbiE